MLHALILRLLLLFFQANIGTQPYCGFNSDTRQWECNYDTVAECVSYNKYCAEKD